MATRLCVLAALALTVLAACDSATQIPAGAQSVHVSMTPAGLQVTPGVASPGDVYLVLDEPLHGVIFAHRTANMNLGPQLPVTPPLPITDADISHLRADGTFMGSVIESITLHTGNVVRIGPLVEGKYALLVENPHISVAILEVRP